MYKETIAGYTFIQEDNDVVKAYLGTTDDLTTDPVFISNFEAKNRKEFEMEVSYILVYHLKCED